MFQCQLIVWILLKINLLLWVVYIKTLLARNEIVSGYGHDIIVNSQMTT